MLWIIGWIGSYNNCIYRLNSTKIYLHHKKVINWESNILVNKFPNWHCLLKKNKSRPLSFDTYKVRLSIYLKNGVDYRNGFTQQIKVFLFICRQFSKLCNVVRFITIWKLFWPIGYIFPYFFFFEYFCYCPKDYQSYHRPRDNALCALCMACDHYVYIRRKFLNQFLIYNLLIEECMYSTI